MYKALIVDDERIIRQGIRMVVPWERLGIGEVFMASSGQEALGIFKEERPDIMITDIRMTEVTGLELISQIRELNEDLKIIVLTGYDSFEYARECLRMRVDEFLLKPVDEEYLIQTIQKLVTILDETKEKEVVEKRMSRIKGTAEQSRLEGVMNDFIMNREVPEKNLYMLEELYDCDSKTPMQIMLVIPAINWNGNIDDDNASFTRITMKTLVISVVDAQNRGVTFETGNGILVTAVFSPETSDELEAMAEDISSLLQQECDVKVKIVLGGKVEGFSQLHISYNEAMLLLEQKKDGYQTVLERKVTKSRLEMFREIYAELKNVMSSNVGNTEKVMRAFDSFCMATDSYNISDSYLKKCCFEIASSVNFSYLVDSGDDRSKAVNALMTSLVNANRQEACEITRKFLETLLDSQRDDSNEIISKTKRYIQENLSRDISVTSIAETFYLTPNYFSRLFKRVTGEGCNEYIVRKRIEQAQLLLETTNFKSGQIASMVGYRDNNYFSLAFKKYVGVSPTQYRKDIREKG